MKLFRNFVYILKWAIEEYKWTGVLLLFVCFILAIGLIMITCSVYEKSTLIFSLLIIECCIIGFLLGYAIQYILLGYKEYKQHTFTMLSRRYK